jgi:hypothetical protein
MYRGDEKIAVANDGDLGDAPSTLDARNRLLPDCLLPAILRHAQVSRSPSAVAAALAKIAWVRTGLAHSAALLTPGRSRQRRIRTAESCQRVDRY